MMECRKVQSLEKPQDEICADRIRDSFLWVTLRNELYRQKVHHTFISVIKSRHERLYFGNASRELRQML